MCRKCFCTEDNCIQCIEKTGKPCHWVEEDLCSACVIITLADLQPNDTFVFLYGTEFDIESREFKLIDKTDGESLCHNSDFKKGQPNNCIGVWKNTSKVKKTNSK
jgi:hypothetical protein